MAPLKRRSTPTRLRGAKSKKALVFRSDRNSSALKQRAGLSPAHTASNRTERTGFFSLRKTITVRMRYLVFFISIRCLRFQIWGLVILCFILTILSLVTLCFILTTVFGQIELYINNCLWSNWALYQQLSLVKLSFILTTVFGQIELYINNCLWSNWALY
jgi:hypothetical protein